MSLQSQITANRQAIETIINNAKSISDLNAVGTLARTNEILVGDDLKTTVSDILGLSQISDVASLQATLDLKADLVNGLVPASQLPSFVDDVIEVANYASLPTTGETGKIYVTIDDNKTYRWSGAIYVEIKDDHAVWGSIDGILSAQTDLQAALDAKGNLVGGNTWDGVQTFEDVKLKPFVSDISILRFLNSALTQKGYVAINSAGTGSGSKGLWVMGASGYGFYVNEDDNQIYYKDNNTINRRIFYDNMSFSPSINGSLTATSFIGDLVSTSNGDINITPNGTGEILLNSDVTVLKDLKVYGNTVDYVHISETGISFDRSNSFLKPTTGNIRNLHIGGSSKGSIDWQSVKVYTNDQDDFTWNDGIVARQNVNNNFSTAQTFQQNISALFGVFSINSSFANALRVGSTINDEGGIYLGNDFETMLYKNNSGTSARIEFRMQGDQNGDDVWYLDVNGNTVQDGGIEANGVLSLKGGSAQIDLYDRTSNGDFVRFDFSGGQYRFRMLDDSTSTSVVVSTVDLSNYFTTFNYNVTVNGSISATDGTHTTKVLFYGITFDRPSNYIRPTTNGGGELYFGGSTKGQSDYTNIKVYTDGVNDFTWNDEIVATQDWVTSQIATVDTLQEVTTNGNTTDQGISITGGGLGVVGNATFNNDVIINNSANSNIIFKNPGGTGNSLIFWQDSTNGNDWYLGQNSENGDILLYNYTSAITHARFNNDGSTTFGGGITATDLEINLVGTNTAVIYGENDAQFRVRGTNDHWSGIGFVGSTGTEGYLFYNSTNEYFQFSEEVRATNGLDVTGTLDVSSQINIGSIPSYFYSLTDGELNVVGTDKVLDDTTAGNLNIIGTSRNSGDNTGFGTSITFAQNVSQYVDGHQKIIGAIKSSLTTATNVDESSKLGFYVHNGVSLLEKAYLDETGFNITGSLDVSGVSYLNNSVSINSNGQALTLDGTDHVYIGFQKNSGARDAYFGFGSGSNLDFTLMSEVNADMILGTNSTQYLRISSAGSYTFTGTGNTTFNGTVNVNSGTEKTSYTHFGLVIDRVVGYIRPSTNGDKTLTLGNTGNLWNSIEVNTNGTNDFKWNNEIVATQDWVETNFAELVGDNIAYTNVNNNFSVTQTGTTFIASSSLESPLLKLPTSEGSVTKKAIRNAYNNMYFYYDYDTFAYSLAINETGRVRVTNNDLLVDNTVTASNFETTTTNIAYNYFYRNVAAGNNAYTMYVQSQTDSIAKFLYGQSTVGGGTSVLNITSQGIEVGNDTSDASTILRRQNTGDYIQLYRQGVNVANISASSQSLRLWGLNSVVINPDSLDVDFYVYSDVNTAILVDGATGNTTFGNDILVTTAHRLYDNGNYRGVGTAPLWTFDTSGGASGLRFDIQGATGSNHIIRFQSDGTNEFEFFKGGRFRLNGNVDLFDNSRLRLGGSYDLQLYHNGSHSYIQDSGTGELRVLASTFSLRNSADTELMLTATENGAVNLYHDNNLKLSTNANGIAITGTANLAVYQSSNLPSVSAGTLAVINDGTDVAYRSTIVGGGSETCLVMYDGTNWIYV